MEINKIKRKNEMIKIYIFNISYKYSQNFIYKKSDGVTQFRN